MGTNCTGCSDPCSKQEQDQPGQLFDSQGQEAITHIVTIVRNIRVLVKNIPEPAPEKDKELIKALCLKVDKCRNQENNPDSQAYKRKLEAMVDEDEMLAEMGGKRARAG